MPAAVLLPERATGSVELEAVDAKMAVSISLTEALDMAGDPPLEAPALEVTDISDAGGSTTTGVDGSGATTTLIVP